jgi:serine/threonine protein kinase
MTMLPQISLGLDYIHTYNPPIIHRDIKPSNILHCRGKYLLGDFGIAKTVDNSHTLVGTNSYRAPELWQGDDQTTSLDIYGLGATIIEALGGFPDLANRPATWQLWHRHLQTFASDTPIASMLASSPNNRPTAHQIIRTLFPDKLPPMEWAWIGSTGLSPKIPRPTPRKGVVSRQRKQPDVTRTKPAKSKNKQRKKSQNLGMSSQIERRARSQSAGASNQTPLKRRRRSTSKSVRVKVLGRRGAGKDLRPRP